MKKYIIILLLVLFAVGCNKAKTNEEEPVTPTANVVVVNLFHWSQCSHCQEEIAWLKEVENRNNNIKVNYYEVTEYTDLSGKVREELGVLSDAVPLTVIGSDYILGFGDSTKAKIMNLVDKYQEKDYCDIVALIKDNKDTTNCYLQNE